MRVRKFMLLMVLAALSAGTAGAASLEDWAEGAGGAASAFVLHESGHLVFDAIFDAEPEIRGVSFLGIPFFAIAPQAELTDTERYVITSAGFWTQHATSEILLSTRPNLRYEHAPYFKGALAFDIGTSVGYSIAAFAHAGPAERDTFGMSRSLGIDEAWVGAMLITPAILDAWRYQKPNAKWAKWASRGVKLGMVLLVFKTL